MAFGSDFHNLGPQTVYTQRNQRRAVVGADGAFNLLGSDWTWATYFQHGENNTRIKVRMITMKPHLNAALDAIIDPATNRVVCRDVFAQQNGCIPFNPFGNVEPSEGQKNYLYGGALYGPGPVQKSFQKEDAFSISFNGSPFENWAGKVSVATGFDYRDENYYVYGDAGGNGAKFVPGVPFNQCVSPQVNSTGGARFDCVNGVNWYAGSFHNGKGTYNVKEAFLETVVPLIDTPEFGKADLNLAGRAARYSTAGDALTWKVGLTYDTPFDGLRFRALQSRDVRAPNLSELFAAPVTANGTIANLWAGGVQQQGVIATLGNPLLKPEKSINTQIGVVLQPSWLPGFRISADYYRIGVKGVIGNVNAATSVTLCQQQQIAQYCSAILGPAPGNVPFTLAGGPVIGRVNQVAYNIASTITDGFNYEASYQFDLQDWDIPGDFTIRELATNVTNFTQNPGLPGQIALQNAGTNDGAIPHWKIFGTQTYSTDKFSVTLSETWISEGVHNRAWIQCAPGTCPISTVNNPTVNDNHVPSIFYLNLGANYNLDDNWKAYVQVDNLLNKSPPPFYANSQNPTANGANTLLYDVIGRMFRVGVRVQN
jgi:outer membrane receptor protein involved in Fe transport